MDTVSKKKRSQIMASIRSKDSKIEILFRKELWRQGYRYRKNPESYIGKPDAVLKKHKTAIFIDSCFWHGCKKHCRIPSTRQNYWTQKIKRNIKRDKRVTRCYKELGWCVIRIWEHELKNNLKIVVTGTIQTFKEHAHRL